MSEYDERIILAQRNIKALNEGLKHVEAQRSQDAQRVEALMGTVTQLQQQVQALTIQVATLRAGAHGRGPTA